MSSKLIYVPTNKKIPGEEARKIINWITASIVIIGGVDLTYLALVGTKEGKYVPTDVIHKFLSKNVIIKRIIDLTIGLSALYLAIQTFIPTSKTIKSIDPSLFPPDLIAEDQPATSEEQPRYIKAKVGSKDRVVYWINGNLNQTGSAVADNNGVVTLTIPSDLTTMVGKKPVILLRILPERSAIWSQVKYIKLEEK